MSQRSRAGWRRFGVVRFTGDSVVDSGASDLFKAGKGMEDDDYPNEIPMIPDQYRDVLSNKLRNGSIIQ